MILQINVSSYCYCVLTDAKCGTMIVQGDHTGRWALFHDWLLIIAPSNGQSVHVEIVRVAEAE